VDELAAAMHGQLLRPGDPAYDPARRIWNDMIDRRPALVARCADDQDVAAAIGLARDGELALAVRGGGHGVAGQALCEGGLVIDLSSMRQVEVDQGGRTVRAQGVLPSADRPGRIFGRWRVVHPEGDIAFLEASWSDSDHVLIATAPRRGSSLGTAPRPRRDLIPWMTRA
jgi:hypothetical protein